MTQRVPDDVIQSLKGSLDPVEVAQTVQTIINRRRMFNPRTYFKNRDGLYVWDTFFERILSKQPTTMPYRGLEGVTSEMLQRNMYDKEIIDELLGGMEEVRKHAVTLDQIAAKIDLQPNGEDGELLNNGYANIFYVLDGDVLSAVNVDWLSDHCKWFVNAWPLDGGGYWYAGDQVFRNTTLVI